MLYGVLYDQNRQQDGCGLNGRDSQSQQRQRDGSDAGKAAFRKTEEDDPGDREQIERRVGQHSTAMRFERACGSKVCFMVSIRRR